jgi:hypothetical protein
MNWSDLTVLLLGAGHGINPGMGWLFAVALGLQEGSGRAVWRALPPLAAGHAAAVALALVAAHLLGRVLPLDSLQWVVAAMLVSLGLFKLARHSHPRLRGMRVSSRQIAVWSLLMATAHGAGLMVVPFAMSAGGGQVADEHAGHAAHMMMASGGSAVGGFEGFGVLLLHTAGYLLVTGVVALLIYWKFGLRFLRKGWINLDLIWGMALIVTGVVTPFL